MVIKDELIASHFYHMILQTIRNQYLMIRYQYLMMIRFQYLIIGYKFQITYHKVPVPYDKVPVPYQVELPRYCPNLSVWAYMINISSRRFIQNTLSVGSVLSASLSKFVKV